MSGVASSTKDASKQGILTNKLLGCKTYLKVFFGKSSAYKSKYTLKPLLGQSMEHFTKLKVYTF